MLALRWNTFLGVHPVLQRVEASVFLLSVGLARAIFAAEIVHVDTPRWRMVRRKQRLAVCILEGGERLDPRPAHLSHGLPA
jgi:hypothetical protein